jgi:hypothetical protein
MKQLRSLVVAAAVLAAGAAAPAWAHGFHGRGGPGGGVLEQLVHPCQAACGETARGCFEDASSTAASCISSTCGAQVTAAQSACKAGRSSTCQNAMNALRSCGQSCLDADATSSATCRTNHNSCIAACDTAG